MIFPRPGKWSHAAGVFFTWDRIFISVPGKMGMQPTIFCKVRKRYDSWLGYFARPEDVDVDKACQHEPMSLTYHYTKKNEEGKEVVDITHYDAACTTYAKTSETSWYEVNGDPADVRVHICKHCGEVYSGILFHPPEEEKPDVPEE